MSKAFFIFFFLLSCTLVTGQNNINGEYTGQFYISDTVRDEIHLTRNCDKTFKMDFHLVEASGKWDLINSKTLRLKVDYSKTGCIGSNKKTVVKFFVEGNKITWKGKSNTNNRRIARDLMKSTGEKITVISTENETPTVLLKVKDFKCE